MKVQLEAARLLTYQSAWRLANARNASLDAAITKLFVSESLVKTASARTGFPERNGNVPNDGSRLWDCRCRDVEHLLR